MSFHSPLPTRDFQLKKNFLTDIALREFETAQNLIFLLTFDSYGIWYNWILLLAVFANCFASHSNLDAVRSGLEIIIRGAIENHTAEDLARAGSDTHVRQTLRESYNIAVKSLRPFSPLHPPMLLSPSCPTALFSGNLECKGVPLHERYRNTKDWVRWLQNNGVDLARPEKEIWSYHLPWPNWYSSRRPKVCPVRLFFMYFCGGLTALPDHVSSHAAPFVVVCALLRWLCDSQ